MMEQLERPLSRRTLLKLTAGGAALASLSGLGRVSNAMAAVSAYTPPRGSSVTMWMHDLPPYTSALQKIVAAYKDQFGVTVEYVNIPFAQFEAKVTTAASGGTGPDIYKIGSWFFASLVSKGLLAPVDLDAVGASSANDLKSRYDPGGLSSLVFEGQLVGLPVDYNNVFLFYRRDFFKQAKLDPNSPPKTWDDAIRMAKRLTKRTKDGEIVRAGLQPLHGFAIWDWLYMIPFVDEYGAQFVDFNKKRGGMNNSGGHRAFQWYADLYAKHKVASTKMTDPANSIGMFARSKAAMTLLGGFAVPLMTVINKRLILGQTFDVAPLPAITGGKPAKVGGYSWGYGVDARSKNQKAAWHFVNYLQSQSAAQEILKAGDLITPITNWSKVLPAASGKQFQVVAAQGPRTIPVIQFPQWNAVSEAFRFAMEDVRNGKDVKRTAAGYDSAVARALRF
jgi:multiple sugar transport system substrate-binding protein